MKKQTATCLLLACLLTGSASAQEATYVFPYEGFRYTQKSNETILTQTNLADHVDLITALGTTPDAILASYTASGIVMEVIPADGGQIAISVTDAGAFADVSQMSQISEARLNAFKDSFESSGMYESVSLTQTQPVCVRLTSSAMYASMPVYTLRYATLHLGRLYILSQTIVGRAPEATDDAQMVDVLSGMKLLAKVSAPTPTPTPIPTPTPVPTPEPTPGVAAILLHEGVMEVSGVPAFTQQAQITFSGTTDPSVEVVAAVDTHTLGKTTSHRDGTFSMTITLPEEGDLALAVMTDTAEAIMSICYELPPASLTLTSPESTTFTGSSINVRGQTEPNATVYVTSKGLNTNVKADKNGRFTIRLSMDRAGSQTFDFRVKAKGFKEAQTSLTLTREFTASEGIADFRKRMIPITYAALVKAPENYAQKPFSMRGRVMAFSDYNGTPRALVCVNNISVGEWGDPIWVVLDNVENLREGNVATFYLVGEGLTLPASLNNMAEIEVPVARASYVIDIK